jgi:hypothetical protein
MKSKWSNFHVTVNLNKDTEDVLPPMRAAVEAMSQDPYLWWWVKRYDGTEQVDFTPEDSQLVEGVRLRAAFEHGGTRNHGLHVHIVVEIQHVTMVQLSKFGICEIFRRFTGENPNCHCRFVKGSGEDKDFILQYITKEVPSYAPKSVLNARLKSAFSGKNEEMDGET